MAKTAHEKLIDKVVKNTVDLERVHEGLQQKVHYLLTRTETDIVSQIVENDPTYPVASTWRKKRLLKLLANVNNTIDVGYTDIKKTVATELKKLSKAEAAAIVQGANTAVGAELMDITLTAHDLEAIVSTTLIDGQTIGKWWGEQSQGFKTKFGKQMQDAMEQIQLGLVKGEAVGELIRRVRGSTELPGMMKNIRRESAALVRTSVMQTANESRKAVYKANQDLIKGYEVIATLDRRTSPICRALDRKLFDKEFKPIGHKMQYPGGPPFHWNCRSTLVPILKSYSELQGPRSKLKKSQLNKLDKLDKGQRASMQYVVKGGQIVDQQGAPVKAALSYDDWLRKQPAAVQRDVLGPTKRKLWLEHNLSMVDMVSQKGRALTVDELIDSLIDEAAMAAGKLTGKQLMKDLLDAGTSDDEVFKKFKAYYKEFGAKGGAEATDDFVQKRVKAYKKWYYKTYKPGVKPPVIPPVTKPPKVVVVPKAKPIVSPKPTPTAEIGKTFKPVKTLEEAQERANTLNLGPITSELSKDQTLKRINMIFEEVEDIYKRFPKLYELAKLEGVALDELCFKATERFAAGLGQTVTGLHTMGLFTDSAAIEIGFIKKLKSSLKIDKGTFVVSSDFRGAFRHEFGHHLKKVILKKNKKKDIVESFFDNIKGTYKTRLNWAKKNISEYAGTTYGEFFAEAFSAYTSPHYGIKYRLPVALEKAFEELIGPHTKITKMTTEFFKKAEHREMYNKWFNKYLDVAKARGAQNIGVELKGDIGRTVNYFAEWQQSANGRWGRALRLKVSQMENRKFRDILKQKDKYSDFLYGSDVRELANAFSDEDYIKIRAATQAYYQSQGIKKVKLYRGTDGGKTGPKYRKIVSDLKAKNPSNWQDLLFQIDEPPAVGWTPTKTVADKFGQNGRGITTAHEFDPEQVFINKNVWRPFEAGYGESEHIVISDLKTKYKLGNVEWNPIRKTGVSKKPKKIAEKFIEDFTPITNKDKAYEAVWKYETYLQKYDAKTKVKKIDQWIEKAEEVAYGSSSSLKFGDYVVSEKGDMGHVFVKELEKLKKKFVES